MSESFGGRLRRERERRHIDLASIAGNTKVKAALFEGLERDDVSRWPSGIFRRSFIRVYANAIGLDPEPIVREFLERFPDPAEPVQPATTPAGSVAKSTTWRRKKTAGSMDGRPLTAEQSAASARTKERSSTRWSWR